MPIINNKRLSNWLIRLIASLAFFSGFFSITQLLTIRIPEHLDIITKAIPIDIHHWGRLSTIMFGFTLIYLSFNLWQHKRLAWQLSIGATLLLVLSLISHKAQTSILVWPIIVFFLLLSTRQLFTVRSEPTSILRGTLLAITSLTIAIVWGTVGFYLLDRRDFGIDFHLSESLIRTIRQFALLGNNDLFAHTRHARWFLASLNVLGLTTFVTILYSLFQPIRYRFSVSPQEKEHVKSLLEKYGRSPFDYFKLFQNKSFYFSPSRQSVIAYRVVHGSALSVGDPVGPPNELPIIIKSFTELCKINSWQPAFLNILPDLLKCYRDNNYHIVKIGEEAIIHIDKFCTKTINNKNFRRIKRKFENQGYSTTRHLPPHNTQLLRELKTVSDEWLTLPGRREHTFTIGYFEQNYLNSTPLFVLRDNNNQAIAFINEIRSYMPGNANIDLMRHKRNTPNGTMEYIFLKLICELQQHKYKTLSLGVAPLAGLTNKAHKKYEERLMQILYERGQRFYSFKGLYSFKNKFDPIWENRFIAYKGSIPTLARIAISINQVKKIKKTDA